MSIPQNNADDSSFVVEVKGSEIVPAGMSALKNELMIVGNFGIGYTMRFPRCRYIYWDKASRDHPTGDDTQDRDMWNCVRLPLCD
jgi:DNA ligase-4